METAAPAVAEKTSRNPFALRDFRLLLMIPWLQRRIPAALMGRMMSLLLLGFIGLVPISQVVAGALVQISLSGLLAAGGFGMALLAIAALASSRIRPMGLEPVVETHAAASVAA